LPSNQELVAVASNCNEFDPSGVDMKDNIEASCDICFHWKGFCDIDIFDDILTSLDQT
jgi:hypothetical protein